LQGGVKGIEADDLIEHTGTFFVGAIAEYDFDAIVISVLHFLHPEFAGGDAIGVREQDDLVPGFFDAHAEGIFLTGDTDCFVFQVDDMKSFEGLFEFVEKEAGIILAIVIDHDHFVGAGVGLNKGAREVGDKAGGFIPGADDDADGMLLGLFFFWGGIEGEPSEEPSIVEQLHQGDQTKNNKKQFKPGETLIQFCHKRSVSGACLF